MYWVNQKNIWLADAAFNHLPVSYLAFALLSSVLNNNNVSILCSQISIMNNSLYVSEYAGHVTILVFISFGGVQPRTVNFLGLCISFPHSLLTKLSCGLISSFNRGSSVLSHTDGTHYLWQIDFSGLETIISSIAKSAYQDSSRQVLRLPRTRIKVEYFQQHFLHYTLGFWETQEYLSEWLIYKNERC